MDGRTARSKSDRKISETFLHFAAPYFMISQARRRKTEPGKHYGCPSRPGTQ